MPREARSPALRASPRLRGCSENVPRITHMWGSSSFLDRYVKSERFQLAHMATHRAFRVAAIEVIRAEFLIGHAVVHDVIRDLEDLMRHGDDRFLMAAMPLHAVIPRLQRGPVAVNRPEGALN